MIVLAIDLGDTTGYAYVWHNFGDPMSEMRLLRFGTVKLGTPIPTMGPTGSPSKVLVERPAYVPGPMQPAYDQAVVALLGRYGKRLEMIRPVDWKPRFKRYPLPARGVLPTQHEKDAYRMAVWALDKLEGAVR